MMHANCHLCGAPDTDDCDCSLPLTVTLTIDVSGPAFNAELGPHAAMTSELARSLRSLADRVQEGTAFHLDGLPIYDKFGSKVGVVEAHAGAPMPRRAERPTVDNIASYLALMQGGTGLLGKSPTYLAEKTALLLEDEPQSLDRERQRLLDEWLERWAG